MDEVMRDFAVWVLKFTGFSALFLGTIHFLLRQRRLARNPRKQATSDPMPETQTPSTREMVEIAVGDARR